MGVEENDDMQAWEVDTEGDQIMHQVGQVLVVVVEEMYQASIETSGGVTEMQIGVHIDKSPTVVGDSVEKLEISST